MKTIYRLTSETLSHSNNNMQLDGDFLRCDPQLKIFCRPSCPSCVPNKNHVPIFKRLRKL